MIEMPLRMEGHSPMLTLREALTLDVFAGAQVLAGNKQLDNIIHSVSVLEITSDEVIKWIKGGELFITSFYAIAHDIEQQLHILRLLCSRKTSGILIFSMGTVMLELSHKLVEEANKLGVPLIVMSPDATYEEAIRALMSVILSDGPKELPSGLEAKRLFTMLLDNKLRDEFEVARYAERANVNLYDKHYLAVVLLENAAGKDVQGDIRRLLQKDSKRNELLFFENQLVLLICCAENTEGAHARLQKLCRSICDFPWGSLAFRIGVSLFYDDITQVGKAYRQALQAIDIGGVISPPSRFVFYGQLGIYALLYNHYDLNTVGQEVKKRLDKLKAYDDKHGGKHFETLKLLSVTDESVEVIAAKLYIHKNTLLYRKNKIIELLGHDPFTMPQKLDYLAYFTAEKLLGKNRLT